MANTIFCAGCKHRRFLPSGGGRGVYYCDWLDTDSLIARKTFCGGRDKEPREKKSRKDEWYKWYHYKGGREKVRYSRKVTQVLRKIEKEQ